MTIRPLITDAPPEGAVAEMESRWDTSWPEHERNQVSCGAVRQFLPSAPGIPSIPSIPVIPGCAFSTRMPVALFRGLLVAALHGKSTPLTPLVPTLAGVRDALYPMTPSQRRLARQEWARVSAAQRHQTLQRAQQGLPALDAEVGRAGYEYGRYLLQTNRSNRLPRWLQPALGALVTVVGVLLLTGVLPVPGRVGAGVLFTVGGLLVMALGMLGWAQRKAAHLLVNANAGASPDAGSTSVDGPPPASDERR